MQLADFMNELRAKNPQFMDKYNNAPAGARHHGARPGGLYIHSFNVYTSLCDWRKAHPEDKYELTEDDMMIIGMLHDVCKVDTYKLKFEKDGKYFYEYDKELIKHHGLASVNIIEEQLGIQLTTLQRVCILLHMSSWENDEDKEALTATDLEWLQDINHIQILQAINWADMDATKKELREELSK